MKAVSEVEAPSSRALEIARERYLEIEPRHIFYDLAAEKVEESLDPFDAERLAVGLKVLLFTWNHYYFVKRKPGSKFRRDLKTLLESHRTQILRYRQMSINHSPDDAEIKRIFEDFAKVLGPVGAAKALHLLAPDLLPLWDNAIAHRHGLWKLSSGNYLKLVERRRLQCSRLALTVQNPLKCLDEWDFVAVAAKRKRP